MSQNGLNRNLLPVVASVAKIRPFHDQQLLILSLDFNRFKSCILRLVRSSEIEMDVPFKFRRQRKTSSRFFLDRNRTMMAAVG